MPTAPAGGHFRRRQADPGRSRHQASRSQGRRPRCVQGAVRQRVRQNPDRRGRLLHRPDPDRRRHGAAGGAGRRHRAQDHLHLHDRPHGHGGGRQRHPQRRLQRHRLFPPDRQGRGSPLCRWPLGHAVGQRRWRRADGAGWRCGAVLPRLVSGRPRLQRRRKESGAERLCQQAGPAGRGQRYQQWLRRRAQAASRQHRAIRAGHPARRIGCAAASPQGQAGAPCRRESPGAHGQGVLPDRRLSARQGGWSRCR